MPYVPWTVEINFASALLLHSCITVALKEASNAVEVSRRLGLRWCNSRRLRKSSDRAEDQIKTSVVLDAYTSVFSRDVDGDLSELYFTNTGLALLAVSLASSVAMNILLSSNLLNAIVATTFGITFLASLAVGKREAVLPVLALRRAGRFIWSDTPFVNFFSLIYIATVRHGQSTLRLQDYVTFRSIAVVELIFMKAQLAATGLEKQERLVRQLVASEWVAVKADVGIKYLNQQFSIPPRNDITTFTTAQRLSVMLFKTTIGFQFGCLRGSLGPASCPLPGVGFYTNEHAYGWTIYRLSDDMMLLSDCLVESPTRSWWGGFIRKAHGVLLRRLGKVRVIYLIRTEVDEDGTASVWHSSSNLVTGVTGKWLSDNFELATSCNKCVIA